MKTSFIAFVCLLISISVFAMKPLLPIRFDISKMEIVDYTDIHIYYAFNAIDINNPETYIDLQRLEIGTVISKYFSYYILNNDSLGVDFAKKNPRAQSRPRILGWAGRESFYWSEYQYSEYFKDFTKKTLTEYTRMPHSLNKFNCQSKETIPNQNWKVEAGAMTIAGYSCKKATCTFRGRNYTAWFTTDIPINNGPFKFGGLPGLILKVYDNDKLYTFECIKIERFKEKKPIMRNEIYKEYKESDRKSLLKLQKEIHENFADLAGWVNADGSPIENKEPPYHALELE